MFVIVGDCVGERKGLPPRGGGVKLSGSEAKAGVGGARSMSDSGKSGSGLQVSTTMVEPLCLVPGKCELASNE